MTRAETKRLEQKRAHAEAESTMKQASKIRDRTSHALITFRAKHDLRPWTIPEDAELQVTYSQLKKAYEEASENVSAAQAQKNIVLATVPKPYLVKRWYEPPIPDDEE